MSTKTFINLPVKDLAKSVDLFSAIGLSMNQQFSDENAAYMVVSDDVSVLLQSEPYFRGFTNRDITDTSTSSEVIIGLSAESREQVDELVGKVVAHGGEALGEAEDQGFMYMRGFRDLDGHQWSFLFMDVSMMGGR
ncbi:VOC family protein [Amycolatopsis palatopharyngis]|uniref:VOC family protein n=1 Tax=Amycolatopsis palatopharyngis TaxID=187982 RepID=UPI000E2244F1|nr:VOC family protein [Amycolatopsis palatopharyngis]